MEPGWLHVYSSSGNGGSSSGITDLDLATCAMKSFIQSARPPKASRAPFHSSHWRTRLSSEASLGPPQNSTILLYRRLTFRAYSATSSRENDRGIRAPAPP